MTAPAQALHNPAASAAAAGGAKARKYLEERGFCRTGLSALIGLGGACSRTEKVCLLLIVNATIGWGHKRWAKLSLDDFNRVAITSAVWLRQALAGLRSKQLIESRWLPSGEVEYSPCEALWAQSETKELVAVCGNCRAIGPVDTYAPLPHSFFRRLIACCDHATLAVVCAIAAASLHWDRTRRKVYVEAAPLKISALMKAAGLEERQVEEGLQSALAMRVITITYVDGKSSLYAVVPENFAKCERRKPRTVTQPAPSPKPSDDGANKKGNDQGGLKTQYVDNIEPTPAIEFLKLQPGKCGTSGDDKANTPATTAEEVERRIRLLAERIPDIEFLRRPHGRCRFCLVFGPVDVLPDSSSGAPPVAARPAAARPMRGARPPGDSGAEMEPDSKLLEEIRSLLAGLQSRFGRPSPEIVREVAQTLAGAPVALLAQRMHQRYEYLMRFAESYKAVVPLAREAAEMQQAAVAQAQAGQGPARPPVADGELAELEQQATLSEAALEQETQERKARLEQEKVDAAARKARLYRERVEYWTQEIREMPIDEARFWVDGQLGPGVKCEKAMREAILAKFPELKP